MKSSYIEIDGDLILSLAASVSSVINNENEYFEYYCNVHDIANLARCAKANRRTLLHDFIGNVCCENVTYIMTKHFNEEAISYMKKWLNSLNIDYSELKAPVEDCAYSQIEEYADKLQDRFNNEALHIIEEGVFHILFNNKDFLFKFNYRITEQIKKLKKEDFPEYLQEDGYLNRENPPRWLKDGVFFRDQGRCQECGTDLTKLFKLTEASNYDHIIPLRQGGINDPTNYQLMCEHCNKSKRDSSSAYRNIIWSLWDSE